jgi:hypothetical protein
VKVPRGNLLAGSIFCHSLSVIISCDARIERSAATTRSPRGASRPAAFVHAFSFNQLVHLVINPIYMEAFLSAYDMLAAENVDDHKTTVDCQWSQPACPIVLEAQDSEKVMNWEGKFFYDDKITTDCQWSGSVSECPSPIDCTPEGDRIPGAQEKVIKVMNRDKKFFYDDVVFQVRPSFKYQKKSK